MFDQDKIIQFLRMVGPTLPAKVAKAINQPLLIASAALSDLSSQGKVKISNLKVGGSPLYYLPGQEEELMKFAAGNINPKDLQVLERLKENKVSRVVIYSPSFAHPDRKKILKYLLEKKIRVSVPSIRAELMDKETLILLKKCGLESLTIAPECGQKLRLIIGKKVYDESYLRFVKWCNEVGFQKLKMYFMIGLPGMTKPDMEEMVKFLLAMKKEFKGRIYVSINYFVPKPGSEFENYELEKKKMKAMEKFIEKSLIAFKLKKPSISTAFREWKFLK